MLSIARAISLLSEGVGVEPTLRSPSLSSIQPQGMETALAA